MSADIGIFLEMIGFGGLLLCTYFQTDFFGHKTWALKNVVKLEWLLKLLRVISIVGIFGGLILQFSIFNIPP